MAAYGLGSFTAVPVHKALDLTCMLLRGSGQ